MELNLCPGCGAFVRSDWDECRVCSARLPRAAVPEDAPTVIELDQDEVLDVLGSGTGAVPEWVPAEEPEAEPAPPAAEVRPPIEPPAEPARPAADEVLPAPPSASGDEGDGGDLEPTIFNLAADTGTPAAHGAHFASTGRRRSLQEWRPGTDRSGGDRLPWPIKVAIAAGALVVLAVIAVTVLGTSGSKVPAPTVSTTTRATAPSTTSTTLGGGFIAYTDPSGRFRAELPSAPSVQHGQSDLGPQDAYFAPAPNGSSVKILVTTLPDGDWSRNDQKLRDALSATARNEGGTVRSSIVGTRSGRRELNGRITTSSGAIDARFFAVGNDLYGVLVTSKSPDGDPALFGRATDRLLVP